ncbi:hypothetical protein LAZ67_3004553, partial [Cordylochernes scorpioides]
MDRKKVCKKSSAKKKMMSIELKREIIEKHEQGVRVVDLSRQYGRSTSMICSVLKRKESIKSVTPAKGLTIISKLRTSLHENVEKLLNNWGDILEIALFRQQTQIGKQIVPSVSARGPQMQKQFDEADSNKEGIATRKKHSRRSDRVRGEEFVKNVKEKIDGNPGKSMRAIAKEMDVGSMKIVRTIHEDLGLKSYALRKGQLLTENMKNNRKGKAAALLNNLKHDSFGMRRFFSDEKNFDVDQKVNPRNDRWICKDPSEITVVMHTKFPASVMVLGVISSEGDVMPPHFFEKGLRMNADTYINVLETVVKPWMDMVAAGR